ncbi:ribonuclease H-like domain-containing protein [Tanacetum coccineum]|uniref:Ribonuclease H-like domain-containing protein n=1 Tax=Tanacetum coccineum TaxID=301880 RepID=A0ABQ4WZH5_9ASTR
MDDFCREKGIKREYSVARTPHQNGVAERRNRTLIEAARTMLADSKLPTTFWAEAISTTCYGQFRMFDGKSDEVTAGTISNDSAGTSEEISQDCIVMPIWKDTSYLDTQCRIDDGPNNENAQQERFADDSNTKDVNAVGQHVNTASLNVNTGEVRAYLVLSLSTRGRLLGIIFELIRQNKNETKGLKSSFKKSTSWSSRYIRIETEQNEGFIPLTTRPSPRPDPDRPRTDWTTVAPRPGLPCIEWRANHVDRSGPAGWIDGGPDWWSGDGAGTVITPRGTTQVVTRGILMIGVRASGTPEVTPFVESKEWIETNNELYKMMEDFTERINQELHKQEVLLVAQREQELLAQKQAAQEKQVPSPNSVFRQLIEVMCGTKASAEQKQNMEDTMLDLLKVVTKSLLL